MVYKMHRARFFQLKANINKIYFHGQRNQTRGRSLFIILLAHHENSTSHFFPCSDGFCDGIVCDWRLCCWKWALPTTQMNNKSWRKRAPRAPRDFVLLQRVMFNLLPAAHNSYFGGSRSSLTLLIISLLTPTHSGRKKGKWVLLTVKCPCKKGF